MRKRLYEIIEVADRGDRLSRIYDWVMMVCIVVSLIPLAFKGYHPRLLLVDKICVIVFIVDYLLRLLTADYKYHQLRRRWPLSAIPSRSWPSLTCWPFCPP